MPTHRRPIAAILALDAATTLLAYLAAFRLRFLFGPLPAYNWIPFLRLLPGLTLLTLFVHGLFGIFEGAADREEAQAEAITASLASLAAAMALSYLVGTFAVPRSVLVLGSLLDTLALFLLSRLRPACRPPAIPLAELLGRPEGELLSRLLAAETEVEPEVPLLLLGRARLGRGDHYTFRLVLPRLQPTATSEAIKRAFDLAVLLVAAPVALVAAGAIALLLLAGEGRPVLFCQERVGRGGRTFRLYKFRTLAAGAAGHDLVAADDPGLTRLGRLLRLTRLDELPQLWNILKGEMSFVGPRPERPEFVARYLEEVPWYRMRLLMRPGLTGLAQLYGSYDLDVREKLKYDVYYLLHASAALDLVLLLRSLAIPLQPRKAKRRRAADLGRPEEVSATLELRR